jgi:hypothetical protein
MTFSGQVREGRIVLEGDPSLPEGAEVRVELITITSPENVAKDAGPTLGEKLMKFAGNAVGLPADASRNHDHYLYGTPKRLESVSPIPRSSSH